MKKQLLSILFSGTALFAFAQAPVITKANNYSVGEKQVTYIADTVGINPGSAGANVTWDFSNLQRHVSNDSSIAQYYATSSSTDAADFPNSNMFTTSVSGASKVFMNVTDDKLEIHGIVSETQGMKIKQIYSNPHTMYTLPMTYNYTFNDKFAATYAANGMQVYRNGEADVNADGYGTLKIMNRTFTDVLRVHNMTQTRDSVNFGMGALVTVVDLESWSYLTPGKKEPILTISHTTSTNSGQTTRSKSVTYNSKIQSTDIKDAAKMSASLNIYPNPATNNCRVIIQAEKNIFANLHLVNQLGQKVKSIENYNCRTGLNAIDVNVADLSKGIYYLQIMTENGMLTEKIIKE